MKENFKTLVPEKTSGFGYGLERNCSLHATSSLHEGEMLQFRGLFRDPTLIAVLNAHVVVKNVFRLKYGIGVCYKRVVKGAINL